jgi:cytochrome c2
MKIAHLPVVVLLMSLFIAAYFVFGRSQLPAGDGQAVIRLSGQWAQLEDGSEAFQLTRQMLAELPGYYEMDARLVPNEAIAKLGVLPLAKLIEAYPLSGDTDGIVLETINNWESYLTVDYLTDRSSVILLYYNGEGAEAGNWPAFGGDIEPLAPFYVFDPEKPIPTFPTSPQYGMIAATQITGIRASNTAARYEPFYSGSLEEVSDRAFAGRKLYLQRCNSCHKGPGDVGGNVSERPFPVLQAHAQYNAAYFERVVINPKQFFPETSMPKHEDFEKADIEALIAFLSESAE